MTKLTATDRKKIFELRQSGVSPKDIISGYFPSISRQTVSIICKKQTPVEPISPTFSSGTRKVETSSEGEDGTSSEDEDDDDESDTGTVKSFRYLPTYKSREIEVQQGDVQMQRRAELDPAPLAQGGVHALPTENFKPPTRLVEDIMKDIQEVPRLAESNPVRPVQQEFKENPERFKALQKIDLYVDKFPQKLTCITGENVVVFKEKLKYYSDFELEALLETIRTRISSNGLQSGMHTIFFTGTSLVENVGTRFGLKLKGYSDNLAKNQSVKDCIDELSIEMISFNNISAEKRLLFLLVMNMVSTHNVNSADESMQDILSQKVDGDVVNKYEEL